MAEQLILQFEEWRKVEAWPDFEISSQGRIRRATNSQDRRYQAGYILKPTPNQDGYLGITVGGKRRPGKTLLKIHIEVCRAFNGPPPEGKPEAAHWDGNNQNNVPSNLRWASHAENMADLTRHGKHRGEKHRDAKLTEANVREIRKRIAAGEGYNPIARSYGVSFMSIKNIGLGKHWAWLKD